MTEKVSVQHVLWTSLSPCSYPSCCGHRLCGTSAQDNESLIQLDFKTGPVEYAEITTMLIRCPLLYQLELSGTYGEGTVTAPPVFIHASPVTYLFKIR